MESNNNDNNNTVSFANEDVEDQSANTPLNTPVTRKSSSELRHAKNRASLSQSAKAWDLDGDGELDDAELALKNMDSSHKGTLSKDQMYALMSDNLQTQRELFKVKKVVIGLVVFTCILAISNLGTSLAAAFLAKDTKVNESDELTSSSTGRTLATDTMTTTFTVDPEFDQQFTRRHRHLCENAGQGGIACTITGSAVNFNDGKDIANKCASNKSVSITKTYGTHSVIHSNICPVSNPDGIETQGSGNNPKMVRITRRTGIIDIVPQSDESAYTITGLTSSPGQACSTNADCLRGELPNTTNPDHVCERATASDEFGVCKANPGRTCTTAGTSECTENFTCEGVEGCEGCSLTCVCASDAACDEGFTCSDGTNGGKACLCENDSACPGADGLCTTECNNPDAPKSCTTQTELDSSCITNYGHTTCGDNKLCFTPPGDGIVTALPAEDGRH